MKRVAVPIAIAAVAATLLAGCGQQDAPAPKPKEIIVRSANQKTLFELTDLNRAIALKRAIGDQGLRCKQIVTTGYIARYKNMDVWTATCGDKREWALFIGADDSVQVRGCEDVAQLGLPTCTIKPGTEGGTGLDEVSINQAN